MTATRDRVASALPDACAIVAESSWIAVVASLVQSLGSQPAVLGLVGLLPFTLFGIVAGRIGVPRLGRHWPAAAFGLLVLAAFVGWLASPEVRDALVGGSPGRALERNPAGWFAALAVLRGFRHRQWAEAEGSFGSLVTFGVPGIALAVVFGGVTVEPWHGPFLGEAAVAVVVFLVATIVGLALARIDLPEAPQSADWRRNRSWLALLAVLVVGIVAISLSASVVVGPIVQLALALAIAPVVVVSLVAGFRQVAVQSVAVIGFAVLVTVLILGFGSGQAGTVVNPIVTQLANGATPENERYLAAVAIPLILVAIVAAIALLIWLWMRDVGVATDADVPEFRVIDRGDERAADGRFGRRRRRAGHPTDAPSAYLALLDDLRGRPAVRRLADETPHDHAARLRRAGSGALGLELLAADYELARFGGRALTLQEDRRAMRRWRRLRSRLGQG